SNAWGQVGPSQSAVPEQGVDVLMITTVAMSLGFLDGLVASLAGRGLRVGVVCSPDLQLIEFARKHGVTAWAVPMSRTITPLRDVVALLRLLRVIRMKCSPEPDPAIMSVLDRRTGCGRAGSQTS